MTRDEIKDVLLEIIEDIEIAESKYPGRYDKKGSRQEPGTEMSVA